MLHVYEFEIFESDSGMFLALPLDMEGGTQGENFNDACETAADWLQLEMEHRAINDLDFPEATFGNEPKNGGKVVIVAVNAGKETVPHISAAEAAKHLGVTRGRVSQMVKAGQLETLSLNGREWVTEYSVNARLEEAPKAGRPKKVALT